MNESAMPLVSIGKMCIRDRNDKVCNYVKTRDGAKGFAQAMREWSEHPEMRPDMQNIKACFESLTWPRRAEYLSLIHILCY